MINKNKIYISVLILLVIVVIAGIIFLLPNKQENTNVDYFPEIMEYSIVATSTVDVRGYTIEYIKKIPKHEPETTYWGTINILKNGQTLFSTDGIQFFSGFYKDEIGDWIKNADDLEIKAIADITGNGIPELILSGFSGGAHCCSHNYIIELDEPLKILFDLDTGNSGVTFEDIDNDGIMEIKTLEDVFTYWYASYANSSRPPVILSLQNGKYRADTNLMRQQPPSMKEIENKVASITSWDNSTVPEIAWEYAIDLIYSGNIASAKNYVDLAWRENEPGDFKTKVNFWKELTEQIQKSPYYSDLSVFFGLE